MIFLYQLSVRKLVIEEGFKNSEVGGNILMEGASLSCPLPQKCQEG